MRICAREYLLRGYPGSNLAIRLTAASRRRENFANRDSARLYVPTPAAISARTLPARSS
jgi:hypothetical protein